VLRECHTNPTGHHVTPFCLFLSLVLTRTLCILFDPLHSQAGLAKLKNFCHTANGAPTAGVNDPATLKKQLANLQAKERDFETLEQTAGGGARPSRHRAEHAPGRERG